MSSILKNKLLICLFLIGNFLTSVYSSTDGDKDSLQQSAQETIFQAQLDTIAIYLYRDKSITEQAFKVCEDLKSKTSINLELLFEFYIQKIYLEHSELNPIKAYETIALLEKEIDTSLITQKNINSLNYITAYTLMSLGEIDEAQETYYNNIKKAWAKKDTQTFMNNNYSLGQLYATKDDLESSINCYKKNIELLKTANSNKSTLSLTLYELAESYYSNSNYDQALKQINLGLDQTAKHNLEIIKCDFLILKGRIFLAQEKVTAADNIYNELKNEEAVKNDPFTSAGLNNFLAELYTAKKAYSNALQVYLNDLNKENSLAPENLPIMEKAHELCKLMGDNKSAYNYLLKYNLLKAQEIDLLKNQKTGYLKIKYESERKELDNLLLKADLVKKDSEQKFLYALISISLLLLALLFGAFFQKSLYNKKLKQEVNYRTENLRLSNIKLKSTNTELDEFNKILSHELKEPLRNIITFSQLAHKESLSSSKIKYYANLAATSGLQLNKLIEDLSAYRDSAVIVPEESTLVNLKTFIEELAVSIRNTYPNKKLQLNYDVLPTLHTNKHILKSVFTSLLQNSLTFNNNQNVNINIKYRAEAGAHHFEIEDNGIGIAPKFQTQIFDMFKRLTDRETSIGSGIGLNLAKKMIQKINGDISLLKSAVNEGSTFLISFPEGSGS